MKKGRLKRWIFAVGLAVLGVAFLLEGERCAAGAVRGLKVCASVVIPALFPFFVLSSMAVGSGLAAALGRRLDRFSKPLFGAAGAAPAFVLGILGGYPSGARALCQMYKRGEISKKRAEFLLASCSNCGAAFILGAAGNGAFESGAVGALLLLCHVAAALVTALVFKSRAPDEKSAPRISPAPAAPLGRVFTDAVSSALSAILAICAYVVFFSVICALLPLGEGFLAAAVTGFLEISTGTQMLSGLPPRPAAALCAAMTGFGGLCVCAQTMNVTEGLSKKFYFPGKLLQAAVSALLAWIFFPLTV
ncbi:MAG: sporulation protein [Oscillospiraceae bacterium]|nr:sporulation protein [Oscillospiraceae bacterium]